MMPKRPVQAALLSVGVLAAAVASAQEPYPSRPVRFVVPYPPGASADFTGREIAAKLSEAWGQQVVVDNRPGAGTTIGHGIVAKSSPDGYTLGLGTGGGLVVNPAMGQKLVYDSVRDFVTPGFLVNVPILLVATSGLPVNNARELIALAKAKPRTINFASPGAGTPNHLGGEMLRMMAGIDIVHVPYKGGGPAATDLAAGAVQLLFSGVPGVSAFLKSGRVKVLATATLKRTRVFPEAAPISEVLPGFDCSTWYGVIAPAGTPKAIVAKVNTDINRIMANADFQQRLLIGGVEALSGTPEEMHRYIGTEIVRWREVIRAAGVSADAMK